MAGVHRGWSALEKTPREADSVVSTLGSRRIVSPSSGKSLSFPFLSRKREGFESRPTIGKPSFDHSGPGPSEQAPLSWASILHGAH